YLFYCCSKIVECKHVHEQMKKADMQKHRAQNAPPLTIHDQRVIFRPKMDQCLRVHTSTMSFEKKKHQNVYDDQTKGKKRFSACIDTRLFFSVMLQNLNELTFIVVYQSLDCIFLWLRFDFNFTH